ncbi:MAG: hypothetical protein Q7R85_03175 [bacterium]|nr:hypothetical protein [bacterium]
MERRQRITFMTALLLLGASFLYTYVPAHYLAEDVQPYAELDEIDLGSGLQDEAALLGSDEKSNSADYTASALDVLTGEE